ncbi:MAG TPA: hypothetical protein DD619_04760 [Alphaproteobacteria bacterium]|nr:hypothetical protein [Alphaproteobacteria bacterium]
MSVYAKDRKTTKLQYIVTAQKLQVAVIQYLMNDNHVPKKWRYMLAQDAILKVSELLDNVVASNTIFPNTEEKLTLRKKYLQQALINCYQLENKMLCMVRTIQSVNAENLKQITSLLFDEVNLIKGANQNAKIISA